MQTVKNIKPSKVINAKKGTVQKYLQEIWKYKKLILVFAYQELKVQYLQTRLGFFWILFKPLMILAVFSFLFNNLIHLPGIVYPYPLFALIGLLVWNNFSYMINNGGNALVSNQQLIKKMYFPRILLIFSKMLVSLVETGIMISLVLTATVVLGYSLHLQIMMLPLFICANLIIGLSIAIWLNALTIRNRDLNQFIPTIIGFMIWLTPVFYPITLVPAKYAPLLYLNPVTGIIQGCRWAILGDTFPSIFFLPSFICFFILLISGFLIFIRVESDLADHI